MPEPGLGGRKRLLCLLALVATFSVVAMSSSLTWPILAESLRLQGYDETAIGLNAAAQFAGIIFVAGSATWLIPRLGFFRAALLGLVLVAAMLAALPTVRDYWVWLALRFVLGVGNSLLFTAGDSWINQIVENRVRGRWMGIYNTAGMAGWAAGPILGSQMDPNTWGPFLAGIGGTAVAFAVLLPTRRIDVRLRVGREARAPLARLLAVFVVAPTVLLSSGMFGVVEGGIQSFAHLYTMDVLGTGYRETGYAVIWVGAVGAIFLQYPAGWLADRIDRGWLLVGCVAVATTAMAIFPWLLPGAAGSWWSPAALALWSVVVAWGGSMGATFTVGLTLVGERFRDVELVAANAMYALIFGVGGLAGPFLAG
ncbi:MAG: MFS transporter, partial [Chromatiales bacterium]|nr:MFS transporter [Chromatiales bacterium]